MTDRAQPGAIKSLARNDELAQILGQLTGGFDDGWVRDPADPTPASARRSDIDETAFDGFALSNVSGSSLNVDVGPGEAFAAGWLAVDTSATVSLPADTASTIVVAMDIDAVYDPDTDADRDAADRVVVDVASNVASDLPRVQLYEATTDGSGVTGTTDLRLPYGPAVTATALEATGTFTDPAGISYSGAINPVQVTEEASTFAESDVTVTHTGTEVKNGAVALLTGELVDDVEDNDIIVKSDVWSGWDGDTSTLSAQDTTVLEGSYSFELSSNNANNEVTAQRDTATIQSPMSVLVQSTTTGSSTDLVAEVDLFSGADVIMFERLDGSGSFANASGSWSSDTTYEVIIKNIDYTNETYDTEIIRVSDNTTVGSSSDNTFINSTSDIDEFRFINDTTGSGGDVSTFWDLLHFGPESKSNGNALVEWDSGVPADIKSYDLATFQRSLDGETVTIDVEDGSGTVLFSDIGQNFDISTVDTTKNVTLRANLSRNDTANNPTIDYLARRFIR